MTRKENYADILEDIFNDDLMVDQDIPEDAAPTTETKEEAPLIETEKEIVLPKTSKDVVGEKEDVKEEEEEAEEEDFSLVQELAKDFGLEDLGEVAEDYQGITKTVKAVGEKLAKQMYEEFVQQYPGLPELHEYLANGGSIDAYVKNSANVSDWTSMKLDKEDSAQHKKIVREYIKRRGLVETDEEIEAEVREIEASGKLNFALAEKAYNIISKQDEAKKAEIVKQQVAENEKRRKESQDRWNTTKEIVTKGQLDNFTIPPKDRNDFFKYIAIADEQGKAAIDKDLAKLTPTQYLELQYWVYKKGQLKDVIETKAKTLATERYRKVATPGVGQTMKTHNKTSKVKHSENLDVNYLVN